MKTMSFCLSILIAGGIIAFVCVRSNIALDDLHNISTDIRAIRESIAPQPVKIRFRIGPSKKDGNEARKRPIILA